MTIFLSLPNGLLFFTAAGLTFWGARVKNGSVLSFFGAMAGALAVLSFLVEGGDLMGCLLYALVLVLLSGGKGKGAGK